MAGAAATASNIVFSNGEYDPWRAGGVTVNLTDRDIVSVEVAEGGHHLDLMWSNPADPQSVVDVRALELAYVSKWEQEAMRK